MNFLRPETKADKIIAAVKENPCLTARQLAGSHGCSKQYVHIVLKSVGLTASEPVRVWGPDKKKREVVPKLEIPGVINTVSTSTSGSISELMTAADLMTRGWKVFFPLFRAHSDLIAQSPDGEVLKRIEVRSGSRKPDGLRYTRRPSDRCEHYAVVVAGEPVIYIPPL